MTALNWLLKEDKCVIAADTLAFIQDNQPKQFVSKILPLPHLNMVICGTGNSELIIRYYMAIQLHVIARDMYSLNSIAKNLLLQLNKDYSEEETSKIFHFGYSEINDRFEGYMFQSAESFSIEKIAFGFGVHPALPFELVENIANNAYNDDYYFTQLISEQKRKAVVSIGGEIQRAVLSYNGCSLSTIFRFEDYEENYVSMLNR